MRGIDFSSWGSLLTTLVGLALFTLIGICIRLLVMQTIQQRQQRMNRQINERLRALMAAYKVLGGSFTGTLTVDPTHLRDLRHPAEPVEGEAAADADAGNSESDRRRRIRDAVEAALSDIFLLGTEEQVRLAERAARELIAGHPVQTHELVVSLRNYIRQALDLDAIPADLVIPAQGRRGHRLPVRGARAIMPKPRGRAAAVAAWGVEWAVAVWAVVLAATALPPIRTTLTRADDPPTIRPNIAPASSSFRESRVEKCGAGS